MRHTNVQRKAGHFSHHFRCESHQHTQNIHQSKSTCIVLCSPCATLLPHRRIANFSAQLILLQSISIMYIPASTCLCCCLWRHCRALSLAAGSMLETKTWQEYYSRSHLLCRMEININLLINRTCNNFTSIKRTSCCYSIISLIILFVPHVNCPFLHVAAIVRGQRALFCSVQCAPI